MEIKKSLLLIPIVFFVSIVFTSCDNQKSSGSKNMSSDFREKIVQELPVGTSKKDIERYLTDNNIEHSWVEEEKDFRAIVRNVEVNGLITKSLVIIISIDENSKLSSIKSESVSTGL